MLDIYTQWVYIVSMELAKTNNNSPDAHSVSLPIPVSGGAFSLEESMKQATIKKFKPTAAYLRIVEIPTKKKRWKVERLVNSEIRYAAFFPAFYYWIVCNLTGKFPPVPSITIRQYRQ